MATDIASPSNNTEIFQELDRYPWDKDVEFQGGLSAILGSATDATQIQELTLRAQVFYLSRKKSIPIDFDAYRAYIASKSSDMSALSSNIESATEVLSKNDAVSLSLSTVTNPTSLNHSSNFSNAPKEPENSPAAPHHILAASTLPSEFPSTMENRDSISTSDPSTTSSKPKEAPYPSTFAEIVHLITTGAPIPGIKEIPKTVLPFELSSKPVLPKRRKPWEKDVPEEIIQGHGPGLFGDRRDEVIVQELPET